MRKRKLVFFDFVTHYGGAQQCTVLLCSELNKSSQVYVLDAYGVCGQYIEALASYHIPTHVLLPNTRSVYIGYKGRPIRRAWNSAKQTGTLLRLRRNLVRQILQINPDLIWTNSPKALLFLETILRPRKYCIAMYAHGWYRKWQVSTLGRWLIRKADCVLAVSNPTAKALESWGVRKERIHVVYNSIDFDQIVQSGSKEPITPLPGMDKDCKILLPAQLLRTKGQHTAIEAAGFLKKKGLDFVMWFAGDTKIGVGDEYRQYLGRIIADYSLETNIFPLGYRKDVRTLMRLSDIVILPTFTEGLPCTVQEAMVLARPVISTPVGGIPDLIVDGQTGFLMPIEDAQVLANRLEKLIRNRELAVEMGKKGYERITEKFNIETQVGLVRQAFEKTIDSLRANK